jgi:hypothetical protein
MLSLEPPFYDLEGITVYRDHALTNQFYYAAPQPKLARTGGRTMFDIMAYSVELKHSVLSGTEIPAELGAGFLTMGTECPLSDMQRSNVLRGLQDKTGIPQNDINLYPVPYHKGSVSVIALDAFGVPGQAPADAPQLKGRPTFVEKILGTGKPSLLGDLRTIFSLGLSQEGVTFLSGLYKDKAAPVGVVYELSFYGLQPSVNVEIKANLARVYQYFGGGLRGRYAWFKADISAALEKLEEQSAVEVKILSQATGEEAQKSKELALSLFRDRIIQELFRPTSPSAVSPSTLSGLTGTGAMTTAATGATTAANDSAAVALSLQFKEQTELKEVVYTFSERAPVERTHAPQGFLPLLLNPTELEQRVHMIDLNNAFFELLEVLVTGPSKEEFEALGIRQIEVVLSYGEARDTVPPESATLVFRPDSSGDKTFAVKRRGRKSLSYRVATTYEFARTSADGDAFRYQLSEQKQTGRSLRINPYADFGVLDVELELGRVHADVRLVDVDLNYATSDESFRASEHFRLTPGSATRERWQVRTRQTTLEPYTVTSTLVFEDGSYTTPPQSSSERLLRIDSPFQGERELLIKPAPKSPTVTQITVELEYDDSSHGYVRRKLVRLEPPFSSTKVSFPVLELTRQEVRYRVTIQEPGLISEGEWQETLDPSIIVGTEGHKVGKVQIQLVGPPLSEVALDAVQVKLSLVGAPEEDIKNVLFTTQSSDEVQLILPPGEPLRYRYQTTAFKSDGTSKESAWKEMTSALLVLQTRSL